MADDFVTLGTFPDPIQAQAAVGRLKDAGIDAFPFDETPGGLGFLTGQGLGWIQLKVRAADLERAEAVLGAPEEPADEAEIPWDDADAADAAEKAEVEQTIAEQKAAAPPDAPADRGAGQVAVGYRMAVLGFFFFPLSVAALVVLLGVAQRDDPLSPADSRKYYLALVLAAGWLALLLLFICVASVAGLVGGF